MTSCCAHTTYRTGASDIMPGAPCRHRAVQLLVALAVALLVLLGCPGRAWAADKSEQAENNAAANEEAGFGLTDFTRYNVGNGRPVEDIDLGYRYPLADDANLVAAVAADGSVLVFVDDKACDAAGFAADDEADVQALRELVEKLDENVSKGGEVLADDAVLKQANLEKPVLLSVIRMLQQSGVLPAGTAVPRTLPELEKTLRKELGK